VSTFGVPVSPRAAALLGVVVILGCLSRRERLDVPRVTLLVDDSVVAPGGTVLGRANVTDESGLIFVSVTVFTADSAARTQVNRIAAETVDLEFALGVSSAAVPDEVVSVRALARDNQDFEVTVTDTVFVRVTPPSP
jgi:hypothetical protein